MYLISIPEPTMYDICLWNRGPEKLSYEAALKLIYDSQPRFVVATFEGEIVCNLEPWGRALVLIVRHHARLVKTD